MSRKRFSMEQIIGLLREVDVKVSQGKNVGQTRKRIMQDGVRTHGLRRDRPMS